MNHSWSLVKCEKPDCWRRVKLSVQYCCTPCATAAVGRYEIVKHSEGCDQRHEKRGDYRDDRGEEGSWL